VFKYALFPQKSGVLEVPAVRFNGFYLTRERRADPFGSFFNDDMFIAGFGMADVLQPAIRSSFQPNDTDRG
jgi:hypothetical protein